MQKIFDRFYTLFEKTPLWVIKNRFLVVLLSVLLSGLTGFEIYKNFELDISVEAWLQEDSEPYQLRNEFRHLFGSDEVVYMVYKPKSGDVFSKKALETVRELHQEIERASNNAEASDPLSHIIKVDSLYNARYQVADGDTLISKKLIGADFPKTKADREERRDIALSQENFRKLFFSDDFLYGGIQIKTDFGAVPVSAQDAPLFSGSGDLLNEDGLLNDGGMAFDSSKVGSEVATLQSVESSKFEDVETMDYKTFMTELKQITRQEKYKDFEFFFAGNPVNNDYMVDNITNTAGLIGLMMVAFVVFLWLLLGSFSGVVWPFVIVGLSILWATGIGTWLTFNFTTMWMLTLMLALAVSIASSIHVLNAFNLYRRRGETLEKALSLAYRKTGSPILMTSVTTVLGMLSLTLSDVPAIQGFGYSSAITVACIFLLILFVLPVMLLYWHPPIKAIDDSIARSASAKKNLQPLLSAIDNFSRRFSKPIVIFYGVSIVFLLIGAAELKLDSNTSELSRKDSEQRVAIDLVDDKMMGAMNMEVLLRFDDVDALKDPVVLQKISAFQEHIESSYGDKIVKTFSLADVVKDSNKVMHGGDPGYHKIPEDPRLASQLLYLFNNSNPSDRRDLVSDDYKNSHISILMRNGGTHEYMPFMKDIDKDLVTFFDDLGVGSDVNLTGSFRLLVSLSDDMTRTQLQSFSTALVVITIALMFALGSVQAGLIASIPNLLPAFFTFGLMGWIGVPLDANTLMVAPVIIGIAVDDTIHFLSHYRYSWMESGDVKEAVSRTIEEVGQAVLFTSLVLGVGFGVLAFSSFLGLARPGLFGSLAILVALLSDLFFLPALLHWLKPDMGRNKALQQVAAAQ